MHPRTVSLIAALCLTGGWLLGSVVSPPTASLQSGPVGGNPPIERADQPAHPYTKRLEVRLDQAPQAPVPERNPFRFGDRPAEPDGETDPQPDAGEIGPFDIPEVALPTGPVFSLSGMAASDEDGQTVRTAIVSDGRTVYYVKAGGTLPGGVTVSRVEETFIVLTSPDGTTRTLSFR